jgi:hypothetical protein
MATCCSWSCCYAFPLLLLASVEHWLGMIAADESRAKMLHQQQCVYLKKFESLCGVDSRCAELLLLEQQ